MHVCVAIFCNLTTNLFIIKSMQRFNFSINGNKFFPPSKCMFVFFILEKGTGTVATGENVSSTSGHRFTVDESSIYWTQQSHEDQQPQFKNDHHQKPPSTGGGRSTVESPQPPPKLSSSSPSPIYLTDDQHNGRRRREDGDKRFVSTRRKDDKNSDYLDQRSTKSDGDKTSDDHEDHNEDDDDEDFNDPPTISMGKDQLQQTVVDTAVAEKTEDFRDQIDDDGTDGDVEGKRDGSNWKSEQHRWMSDLRRPEDEDASFYVHAGEANGYQSLTCRVMNNFYTHFRW